MDEVRISQILSLGASTQTTSIAFFYCKHKDSSRNSFLAVAKGLLSQLLDQNKHLTQYFYEKSSNCGETSLHTKMLAGELLRVALSCSKRTYIVLDGLDECDAKERKYIVEFFRNTVEALPIADMGSIRCLFVSQDDREARKDLSNVPSINICPSDTKHDIHSFVLIWKDKIEKKFGDLQEMRHEIAKIVTAKAQGIPSGLLLHTKVPISPSLITRQACSYSPNLSWRICMSKLRWRISFQNWQTFRRGSTKRMFIPIVLIRLELFVVLKLTTESRYARIVERILNQSTSTRRSDAQRLLQWLVCAKRPLRWYEFQATTCIDLKGEDYNPKRFSQMMWRETPKDLCGSLIEHHKDGTVDFVHPTARE